MTFQANNQDDKLPIKDKIRLISDHFKAIVIIDTEALNNSIDGIFENPIGGFVTKETMSHLRFILDHFPNII